MVADGKRRKMEQNARWSGQFSGLESAQGSVSAKESNLTQRRQNKWYCLFVLLSCQVWIRARMLKCILPTQLVCTYSADGSSTAVVKQSVLSDIFRFSRFFLYGTKMDENPSIADRESRYGSFLSDLVTSRIAKKNLVHFKTRPQS